MGDEVSEFIGQIMNQELDTIVDDNSLEELGDRLCTHFRLAMDPNKEGDLSQLHIELDTAAAAAKPLPTPQIDDDSSSSDDDDDAMDIEEGGEGDEIKNVTSNSSTSTSTNETNGIHRTGHNVVTEPDEEGWVTVVKSKKH
jgi:hypothetical protein